MTAAPDPAPLLRVVSGDPDAGELAALLAVLRARAGRAAATATRRPRPAWSDPRRLVRAPVEHGPGAWQRSGLPR